MTIRRRATTAVTLSGIVDVDLDHTTDSFTLGDETNKLSLIDVTGVKTIPVKIYGAIAGGAAMLDDAAFVIGTDTVNPMGAVYKLTPDTIDDGDVGAVHMTATRAMHVYIKGTDVGSSGGTSAIDSAAYTAASSNFTPTGGAFDDVGTTSLTEGQMGIVRLTALRKMMVYDSAVEALLTTQAGYLDGIEGLLTTQAGYLDGLETLITSTNTKLDTIIGHVDGIETLIGTTNTNTGNIVTSVQLLDDVIVADNAGFTDGTTKLSMQGFIYDEVAGTALTENDAAAARIDVKRAQIGVLEDGVTRGRYATVSAANALKVDNSAVTQPVSGTFWQATQPISGNITTVSTVTSVSAVAALTSAAATAKFDIGLINAVTPLMGAGNTGTGSMRVTIASDNADVSVKQATAASLNAQVVGNVAHDGVASGNPVMTAGRAKNTNPTSVADGDVSYLNLDLAGRAIVALTDRALAVRSATITLTATTETAIIAAGAAGVFHDLTMMLITNTSATAVRVDIRDATAGTIQFSVAIAANGGAVIPFGINPLTQTTAANNWTAQLSAAVTDVRIMFHAIKKVA